MHLWNVKTLGTELRQNALSEKQKFQYLFLYILINTVFAELAIFSTPNPFQWIESTGVVLITVLGTLWCFKINERNDNERFIERLICLRIPVLLRLIVFVFIVFFIVFFLLALTGYGSENPVLESFMILLFEAIYFLYLGRAIHLASAHS